MQNQIIQLINILNNEKLILTELLKKEKQQKSFLSTSLFDLRYSLKQHKKEITKLEKKYNRIKYFRIKKLSKFLGLNQ